MLDNPLTRAYIVLVTQAKPTYEELLAALEACYEVLALGSYHNAPCVEAARLIIESANSTPVAQLARNSF